MPVRDSGMRKEVSLMLEGKSEEGLGHAQPALSMLGLPL